MLKIILSGLFLLVCAINPTLSIYCFWNTGCPYKFLSTETSYDSVRGDMRDSAVNLKGCEPISMWGIYRHGKRKPSIATSTQMKDALQIQNLISESYKKHHSSICAQDVENLLNWNMDNKFLDGKQDLTEEGMREMVGLGNRLKEAFPLLSDVRDGDYTFRPAKGPWIEESIKYFVKGLGKNIKIDGARHDSDVMAPNCEKRNEKYDDSEVNKFMGSSDYLKVKDRIQRRTGLEFNLSDANVSALYDLCRYTWTNKASPWCALFTTEDLQVLEYIEDLKLYYTNGYGLKSNEKVGRIPLADLYNAFMQAKEGKDVTNDATIDQIFTALGLFKDASPLTAAARSRDRKWRTSYISVFSANLVAVLNRCNKGPKEEYNVVFYFNEEPIATICEEGVCSWQEFENKLGSFTTNLTEACAV
ncbi:multiple inositol polyphosphate phosphatase 1-like [Aricia agestis]|uniref:multiple inositol polyphosphate phosphatase 1-like n=1 Tax=Aricia agestis TaxID=91739 RepID=UPI001C203060|nr:multiple inositol polyphosphate phosphatase 1-like [Aricia agestis]